MPWTRIYVPDFSESATKGFYITNLFSFDGSCMYLSLNQASFESMNFIKLEPEVIMERVNWAREISKNYLDTSNLEEEINLSVSKGDKAYQYQKTNIYSKKLKTNEIPDDEDIEKSLLNFIQSLEAIYSNLSKGKVFSNHFEISEELINENYELASVSNSNSGQGLLKYEERNAVDKHGMLKAKEYFKSLGWDVKDVSKVYGGGRDLDCKKNGIEKVVEVKKTNTSSSSNNKIKKPSSLEIETSRLLNSALANGLISGSIPYKQLKNELENEFKRKNTSDYLRIIFKPHTDDFWAKKDKFQGYYVKSDNKLKLIPISYFDLTSKSKEEEKRRAFLKKETKFSWLT